MNDRLKSGETVKIGIEGNFDNEVIMSMNPDVIFISPFKRGGYDAMQMCIRDRLTTVASAAPDMPISHTKIRIGSSTTLMTAPLTIPTMAYAALP